MNYARIRQSLRSRTFFGITDVQNTLGITRESARVVCTRLYRQGLIVRLKRDFYVLREKWDNLSYPESLKIANYLQVPSYISCMSALTYYDISTQVQRRYVESIALKRSKNFEIEGAVFRYLKISKRLYTGFIRHEGIFIATPEKAFLDALYLYSFGKYTFDLPSLSLEKLSEGKVKGLLDDYPPKTQRSFEKIWKS